MMTPTPIRPLETLPQSLIDAMQEADSLGIKGIKGYIAALICRVLEDNPEFRELLLIEVQKKSIKQIENLESWLIKDISDHKSKGQLVKFRRQEA